MMTSSPLKKKKCKANNLYIDHIIDHRDALALFGVLLKAIDSYKPGTFAEVDRVHNIASTLRDYVDVYANTHEAEFN